MGQIELNDYSDRLACAISQSVFFKKNNGELNKSEVLDGIILALMRAKANGKKIMFIGNGGSATVAGHMAEDFSKVGGIRSMAFNDAPLLTCLGNDYSFEQIFEKAIEIYGDPGDILFAVSSSGKSKNILNGVEAARRKSVEIVTLSGFDSENPLSKAGDINIHTPSRSYGIVENAHSAIIHYFLDYISGKLTDAVA